MTEVDYFVWRGIVDSYFEVNSATGTVYCLLCIFSVVLIMDGLFRGYRTPPRRSASGSSISPFNTSPSQLQEVTLGGNGTLADQSKISPMRGRSVKEYDEQLTALKKENFNLKLRIYFLEERMGSTFRLEDKDNIIRKNIEYQVDIETLRKELDEKQDLLCQAVKALELEDEEHKRILANKDAQLAKLTDRVTSLENDLKQITETNVDLQLKQSKLVDESVSMYSEAFGLQTENTKTMNEMKELNEQVVELEAQLAEEREHSLMLENDAHEVECLQLRCKNLETELTERDEKLQNMVTELEENGHTISSYSLRVRTLEDALKSTNSDLNFKDEELLNRDKFIQEQSSEIDELRKLVEEGHLLCEKEQRQTENLKSAVMSRDNTIADLENKLEKSKSVIRNLEAKLDSYLHENKRQRDELATLKQQRRIKSAEYVKSDYSPRKPFISSRTYAGSTSNNICSKYSDVGDYSLMKADKETANSDTMVNLIEEIKLKDHKLLKLEEDRKKTLNLIQTFIAHIKSLEKELLDLKNNRSSKEHRLDELQKLKYATKMGDKSGQFSLTSSSDPTEKENSVEDSDELKGTSNMFKYNSNALEWEKQVEGLIQIIQEKEEELDQCKAKFETTSTTLKLKDNRIVELEREVIDLRNELNSANKHLDEIRTEKTGDKPVSWQRLTEEKDKKIEQLEHEVRKKTSNLQGLLNTELWDKNREIGKMTDKFTEKLQLKDEEVSKLERDIIAKDMQLKMLKHKISELGVQVNLPCSLLTSAPSVDIFEDIHENLGSVKDLLKDKIEECKYLHIANEELRQQVRNTPERDGENKLHLQLKTDYVCLQRELEKSENLRLETVNLCSLLTTRLEELAHFLDSLLKHKSVLGALGSKQRTAIKQAIDQSLDLSKSLSVSMMYEDQSLAQLSSISGLLNTTQNSVNVSLFDVLREEDNDKSNASLTFNSHLSRQRGDAQQNGTVKEQAEIINVLRAQVETMKKEIELRDMELGKQNIPEIVSSDVHELQNDNDLVDVLIDLHKSSSPHSKKQAVLLSPDQIYQNLLADKSLKNQNDNQSESEAWSEPDRCVSRARIGLHADALKNTSSNNLNRSRSNKSASTDGVSSDSTEGELSRVPKSKRNSGSGDSRNTIHMLQDNITSLETQLKEKENEILTLKTAFVKLDNKSLELKLHTSEDMAKLRNEKMDMENLLKETEERIKAADGYNINIVAELQNLKQDKYVAENKTKEAIIDTEALRTQLRTLEEALIAKESQYQTQLQETEDKWKNLVLKVEQEAEIQLKDIQQASDDLRRTYENEWILKTEFTKHLSEMQSLYDELESLKGLLKSMEIKMKRREDNEIDLKNRLQESEEQNREKIIALKRELNETTLRISQTVIDRTKINNEKVKLESELRKIEVRESEKCKELYEKEKEYVNMKNNLQKQITQAEQQKSCLQLRVSELETLNAELHNRLVKLQTSSTENLWAKAGASSPPKISELLTNIKIIGKHSLGTRIGLMRQRSDMSGYASEDVLTDENEGGLFNRSAPESYHWLNNGNLVVSPVDVTSARHAENSSPDLGIESDQGRFSSLETNIIARPLLQTLELTASMNNLLSADQLDNVGHYCNIIVHKSLEKENVDLKKNILKLEAGLDKTMYQLSLINQNKKQVEKAMCKQIHKTSIVLRQARANLDSGSESEIKRK